MANLSALRNDHPLRNRPLAEIGARWRGVKESPTRRWQVVKPSWRIASKCYNDLGETWLHNTEWEAEG